MSFLRWQYVHPEYVHLIWAALAIVGVLAWLELGTRSAMTSFLSPIMQRRLAAQASTRRIVAKLALLFGSLAAGVVALMQPQVPDETETIESSVVAGDIVFVLDTSRSMLATDAAPDRLTRAKAEISDLVSRLENQRVGLVAFAGRAAPVCPLTPDHAYFTTVLGTVDTRSAGRGGSRVGEALKVAVRGFPTGPGAKLIVLITDGDDQDPYTEAAAQQARDAGVKIVAIGIGSEAGSTITLTDPATGAKTTLMHDGQPVISKLDGDKLREIALVTEGAYIPAGTGMVDLKTIMKTHVEPMMAAAKSSATREVLVEQAFWMVIISLACLLAALWVGSGAGERRGS